MKTQLIAAASLVGFVSAQQPGGQKDNKHPSLATSTCDGAGVCTARQGALAIDSNWMWVHKKGTYQPNCFDNNMWNADICSDPAACAAECAIDVALGDYGPVYGATAQGAELSLQFATLGAGGAVQNVGSRSYLLDASGEQYEMFKLKNREFTFDVDVGQLPCGLNGALYFVEMAADGGKAQYAGNGAGAKYGTGYCDAQCPRDIKFINGEANLLNWTKGNWSGGATGAYGSCCTEMDIWESNSIATALTPHACTVQGQTRCTSDAECAAMCDTAGCDLNPYRNGNATFFGPGAGFTLDSTKPMTVVTQFITADGTDAGDLTEIRRVYVQDNLTVASPFARDVPPSSGGALFDSINGEYCTTKAKAFAEVDGFTPRGGLKAMGEALDRGMVLVMSLWDDGAAHMKWLDSAYPPSASTSASGVTRGSCATTAGDPAEVEKHDTAATVKYSNIRSGPIGSTTKPTAPTPAPPPTPAPTATCTGCGHNCHGDCSTCGICVTDKCASEALCMGPCNSGGNAMWCGGGSTPTPPPPEPTPPPTPPAPPAGTCTGCGHACANNDCSKCGKCTTDRCDTEALCMGPCNSGGNALWCGGGSTPTPPPPEPTPAPPTPTPSGCPGGSLTACINLCPSDPPAAYKACVADCVSRCG